MKITCPRSAAHRSFLTIAAILQAWEIDDAGNQLAVKDATLTEEPEFEQPITCAICGALAKTEGKRSSAPAKPRAKRDAPQSKAKPVVEVSPLVKSVKDDFVNPAGFTPDQIGVKDGYRLLSKEEVQANLKPLIMLTELEAWNEKKGRWEKGQFGSDLKQTYRTKLSFDELTFKRKNTKP